MIRCLTLWHYPNGISVPVKPSFFLRVGTARCAVRAAQSGATDCRRLDDRYNSFGSRHSFPPAVRAGTSQRNVPIKNPLASILPPPSSSATRCGCCYRTQLRSAATYFFVAAGNSFQIQSAIAPPKIANGMIKIGHHCQLRANPNPGTVWPAPPMACGTR